MLFKHLPVEPWRLSLVLGVAGTIGVAAHLPRVLNDAPSTHNILIVALWLAYAVLGFMSSYYAKMVKSAPIAPWRLYLLLAVVGVMGAVGTFKEVLTHPVSSQSMVSGVLWILLAVLGLISYYLTRKGEGHAENTQASQ